MPRNVFRKGQHRFLWAAAYSPVEPAGTGATGALRRMSPFFVHPTKRSLCYGERRSRTEGTDGRRTGRSLPRDGSGYRPPAGPAVPWSPLRVVRFACRPSVTPELAVRRCVPIDVVVLPSGAARGAARSAGADGARRAEGLANGRYPEPSAGSAARRAPSRLLRPAPSSSVARASRHVHFTCRNH